MTFWLTVCGFIGLMLLFGLVADGQKRRRRAFYAQQRGTDAPFEGPDPAVVPVSLPLHHP